MQIENVYEIKEGPLQGRFYFTFSSGEVKRSPLPPAQTIPRERPRLLLIATDLDPNYMAKCHMAFYRGLMQFFDVSFFNPFAIISAGKKTDLRTCINDFCNGLEPDLILEYCTIDRSTGCFASCIQDIAQFCGLYCLIYRDFWNLFAKKIVNFVTSAITQRVNYILTYFPHPLFFLQNTPLLKKIIYLLPCFDPVIFKDWSLEKDYDIGFLATGTNDQSPYYPERFALHSKLLKKELKYLHAAHPARGIGSFHLPGEHPLVGRGFSQSINRCKGFINTGGIYKTPNPRTVEVMASNSCLFAYEHFDLGELRLVDGENYICINDENALEKIEYYLSRPELCASIARNGMLTAFRYHTGVIRAAQFKDAIYIPPS
jgi:Uncharacterized protein conserved in bacteria